MAKSVQINISADTKAAVKSMADLELESDKTLKTLNEMEEQSEKLNEALKNVEVGTEAYEELRKEMIKVNTEIKNQELAMEALDNEQVASELKSVAGGFVDMAWGMALVGVGNESLEKVVQTMAQVEGATKIVTGAMESYASLMKLSHTITTAYASAVSFLSKSQVIAAAKSKILAVAQAVLNAVMNANPILLIVTGIAALIAGIVALVMNIKKVIKWLKDMSKYLLLLLGPIGMLTLAWIKLRKTQEDTQAAEQLGAQMSQEIFEKRIANLDKLIDKQKEQLEEMEAAYESEIRLMESLGENSNRLREEQLRKSLEINETMLQAAGEQFRVFQEQFAGGIQFNNKEEIDKYFDDVLDKQDEFLGKKSLAELVNLEVERGRLKISLDQYNDYTNKRKDAEADLNNFKRKLWKEELERQKQFLERNTKNWEKFDKIEIELMEDGFEKRRALAQHNFNLSIKGLKENIYSENELIKQAKRKLDKELAEIDEDEWQKEMDRRSEIWAAGMKARRDAFKTQLEFETKSSIKADQTAWEKMMENWTIKVGAWQKKHEGTIAKIQESFSIAAESLTQIFSLAQEGLNEAAEQASFEREERYGKETEALKNQLANREIDQEEYDNQLALLDQKRKNEERMAARKAFNQDKAFRISQAIMGTAQAVISGLSAPFPLGVIQAGINAALGAAQIGIISAQKFRAAKGGIVPGQPSNVDSVDAMLAPGEAVINSTSTSAFAPLLSAINEAGGGKSLVPSTGTSGASTMPVFPDNDKKIYVSVEEFNSVDKGVTRIEEQASF